MGAGADWFEALGAAVAGGSLAPEVLFYGAGLAVATGGAFASGAGRTALGATGGGGTLLGSGGAG